MESTSQSKNESNNTIKNRLIIQSKNILSVQWRICISYLIGFMAIHITVQSAVALPLEYKWNNYFMKIITEMSIHFILAYLMLWVKFNTIRVRTSGTLHVVDCMKRLGEIQLLFVVILDIFISYAWHNVCIGCGDWYSSLFLVSSLVASVSYCYIPLEASSTTTTTNTGIYLPLQHPSSSLTHPDALNQLGQTLYIAINHTFVSYMISIGLTRHLLATVVLIAVYLWKINWVHKKVNTISKPMLYSIIVVISSVYYGLGGLNKFYHTLAYHIVYSVSRLIVVHVLSSSPLKKPTTSSNNSTTSIHSVQKEIKSIIDILSFPSTDYTTWLYFLASGKADASNDNSIGGATAAAAVDDDYDEIIGKDINFDSRSLDGYNASYTRYQNVQRMKMLPSSQVPSTVISINSTSDTHVYRSILPPWNMLDTREATSIRRDLYYVTSERRVEVTSNNIAKDSVYRRCIYTNVDLWKNLLSRCTAVIDALSFDVRYVLTSTSASATSTINSTLPMTGIDNVKKHAIKGVNNDLANLHNMVRDYTLVTEHSFSTYNPARGLDMTIEPMSASQVIESILIHSFQGLYSEASIRRKVRILQEDSIGKLMISFFDGLATVISYTVHCGLVAWSLLSKIGFIQPAEVYLKSTDMTKIQTHLVDEGLFHNSAVVIHSIQILTDLIVKSIEFDSTEATDDIYDNVYRVIVSFIALRCNLDLYLINRVAQEHRNGSLTGFNRSGMLTIEKSLDNNINRLLNTFQNEMEEYRFSPEYATKLQSYINETDNSKRREM